MEIDAVDAAAEKKEYVREECTDYIDTLMAHLEKISYIGTRKRVKVRKGNNRGGGKGKDGKGKGKDEKSSLSTITLCNCG